MKISRNWIQDFIDLPANLTPAGFSKTMTLSVCEVEGLEVTGAHLNDVVAAKVCEVRPHPDAEKLQLVTVVYGAEEPIEVVCGADNFHVGSTVVYAGLGAELPGGFKIKKAKIRGVVSLGMLCAEDELGFSEEHDGLMLLDDKHLPGTPLSDIYPDQLDWVLEIDNKSVTHRPDLWGHYGFARELAAVFDVPLRPYKITKPELPTSPCPVQVTVDAPELVPRYSGLMLKGLQVCPSSDKIQLRLFRVGMRPINNLVDVTNYVMLDLGQPMHAFDGSKIAGNRLDIRLAKADEKVMTLYNKEVTLGTTDLTIADANGPAVVAGVIGGLDSGVAETANSCFLEAANWDPVAVRLTASKIGLRTDASQRFEKALDPATTELAIFKAVELLQETCPDLALDSGFSDHWGKEIPEVTIETSYSFLNQLLGTEIESSEVDRILTALEYQLSPSGDQLTIEVPGHRRTKDVSIPEDIAEDVGRIFGLDKIKPQAPLFPVSQPTFNRHRQFENRSKRSLMSLGFHEIYSYPLTDEATEARFGLGQDPSLVLRNPVVDHQDRMRTSLLPHMVDRVMQNQKLTQSFKLFEVSRIYQVVDGEPVEPYRLAMALSLDSSTVGEGFYQIKADLIELLGSLQIPAVEFRPLLGEQPSYVHPYVSAEVWSAPAKGNSVLLGTLFGLTPSGLREFDVKDQVVLVQLNFDQMFELNKPPYVFKTPAKFPAVYLDLSLLVDRRLNYQMVQEFIFGFSKLVESVQFLDVYYSEELGDKKSLSVSVTFRKADGTLSPEETKDLQDRLIGKLAKQGYQLR